MCILLYEFDYNKLNFHLLNAMGFRKTTAILLKCEISLQQQDI